MTSDVSGGPDARYGAPLVAALPRVCAALVLLFAAQAVVLQRVDGLGVAPVVATSSIAVLTAAGAALMWRRGVPPLAAELVAGGLVVLVGVQTTCVMALAQEPAWTALVAVDVAAAGTVVSLPWFAGSLYVCWGSWVAGALILGWRPAWPASTLAMAGATAVAVGLRGSRRRALDDLAEARTLADAISTRDALTGMANRQGLAMLAAPILEAARRRGDALHAVFLDVDDFAALNEQYGRGAGDDVLVCVAEAMRSVTRATDVVARLGGDEFCVVGPGAGMAPIELERRVRQRLVDSADEAVAWTPQVSAGSAMLAPWDSGDLGALLAQAEEEMRSRRALRRRRRIPGASRDAASTPD